MRRRSHGLCAASFLAYRAAMRTAGRHAGGRGGGAVGWVGSRGCAGRRACNATRGAGEQGLYNVVMAWLPCLASMLQARRVIFSVRASKSLFFEVCSLPRC